MQPRKMKHRKWHKGRSNGISRRGAEVAFGNFGLKAMGSKWITGDQIEASRRAITRTLNRKGKLWIRIFPTKPVTSKGAETPMGGGKGSVSHYVFPIRPGRIIFELSGIEEDSAKEAFRKAGDKLPIKTKFVKRFENE